MYLTMEQSSNTTPTSTVFEMGSTDTMGKNATDVTSESSIGLYAKIIADSIPVFIMLSVGCTTDVRELLEHLKHPLPSVITALVQFILMPIIGLISVFVFSLQIPYALGILITVSCPGGAFSNVFCYFADGDLSLSVLATSTSNIITIGALSILMTIYGKIFQGEHDILIPYKDIGFTVLLVVIPIAVGLAIRWKSERFAKPIQKASAVLGFLAILATTILFFIQAAETLLVDWGVLILTVFLPCISFTLGFALSTLARVSSAKRTAIAAETGFQNTGIAVGVITISFADDPNYWHIFAVPFFYSLFQTLEGIVAVLIYRLIRWKRGKHEEDKADLLSDDVVNTDTGDSNRHTYGSADNDVGTQ